MSTYNIGMNNLRKFVSYFGDFWQRAKQEIPDLLKTVNPFQTVITTIKKGYDQLKKMVAKDSNVHEKRNNENAENTNQEPTVSVVHNPDLDKYTEHLPSKQFKNIATTYEINFAYLSTFISN